MNINLQNIKESWLIPIFTGLIGLITGGSIMGSTSLRYDAWTGTDAKAQELQIKLWVIDYIQKNVPPDEVQKHIEDKTIHK